MQRALRNALQTPHFSLELEAQLFGFVFWKPLCHVREDRLPHASIPFRPRHFLGRTRFLKK